MHRPPAFAARLARALPILLVTMFVAGVVTACELMESPASASPSARPGTSAPAASADEVPTDEVPTHRPEPSGEVDLINAADALADFQSYRVAIVTRGLVPSSAADGKVTMNSTLVQGDNPAADFTMTGVDGFEGVGNGPLRAIVIGDRAWLRSGSGGWVNSPGGAADFDALFTTLSPTELVSGFEALGPAFVKVGAERKNGRATTHYRVDPKHQAAVDAGLTSGGVDAWIADDGGALISLAADGAVDVDGSATPVILQIDVTRIDDPANRIRPPV
jgi:hypothetical protein